MQVNKPICPACHSSNIVKSGFVQSRALKSYHSKIHQSYRCKNCLLIFSPTYARQLPFYPLWLKKYVIEQFATNPLLSCPDINKVIKENCNIDVPIGTIRYWIINKSPLRLENKGNKVWVKRRKKYGSNGTPIGFSDMRQRIQTELWKNPEYRDRMVNIRRLREKNDV